VGIHRISRDGSLLAYEVRHGGEDKTEIRILYVEDGRTFPDKLETGFVRGFVFTQNNDGFYYCQETSTTAGEHTIRLHMFHESDDDEVIFRAPRPPESSLVLIADATHLGVVWRHRVNSEIVADFSIANQTGELTWAQVFAGKKLPHSPILCHRRIFVLTQEESPNFRVIELSSEGQELRTIVCEQNTPIRQLAITRDRIYVSYYDQSVSSVRVWSLTGEDLGTVDIPTDGSIRLLANQHQDNSNLFFTYESFGNPPTIFEYTSATNDVKLWHQRVSANRQGQYAIRHLSVPSKDGIRVPLTLVVREGTDLSQPKPVIMTGYGGFGVLATPQFSALVAIMMELGAIFALPQIRGGGDLGRWWHDAGRARNRQAAFDDFLSAAEWLCSEGITTQRQLAIFGGSNSGLLVGAAMTQRPSLFGAVLCMSPWLDMVRYEFFGHAAKWRHEFGTVNDPDEFRVLYTYSPYQRVEEDIDYPPVMFVSGDKDDRCDPAHVRKMAARLQERHSQKASIIVDYSEQRGHATVLPLSTRVGALARRLAFLCRELNIPLPVGGFHETICD
jgi:prolyl oligopeptidase